MKYFIRGSDDVARNYQTYIFHMLENPESLCDTFVIQTDNVVLSEAADEKIY